MKPLKTSMKKKLKRKHNSSFLFILDDIMKCKMHIDKKCDKCKTLVMPNIRKCTYGSMLTRKLGK